METTINSRPLTADEVRALQENGCQADDWSSVRATGFIDPTRIRQVEFVGQVIIGDMSARVEVAGMGLRPSSIVRTTLCNVTLGASAYVCDATLLSGYAIGDNFVCMGCGNITADRDSTFGIGTRVSVVNEGGGREVALSAHLTSNIAYVVAHHQYRDGLAQGYETLVDKEAEETKPIIGNNVTIASCRKMQNVRVGNNASIDGAALLYNGTILSCKEQPTFVGADVTISNFVMAEGAKVANGAKLTNAYVGNCVEIGAGFVGEGVLVFACSQLLCGEGVALLAGPFTVSHHKTSLLIAETCSFYNAGSATNSSNHHYRLGPLHQAVLERGVKTGSGSYVLQPAHIGAFSMVVGHHKSHPDVADFPFSTLVEKSDESHLLIGQNLKTMGLFRDSRKWPKRDKRVVKRDCITFGVLNPQTVGQMMAAIVRMEKELMESKAETLLLGGVRIKVGLLGRAVSIYRTAVDYYLSKAYVTAQGEGRNYDAQWEDCGGMVAPVSEVKRIENGIIAGEYATVADVADAFAELYDRLPTLEQNWAVSRARTQYGYSGRRDDMADAAQRTAEASRDLREGILSDAAREWNRKLMVSYGLDGSELDQTADYELLKGKMDENVDVRDCQDFFTFSV